MTNLAFGMWRSNAEINTPENMKVLLEELLAEGISIIDLADIYGEEKYGDCEVLLGQCFAKYPDLRNKFKVVTKCGIVSREKAVIPHYNNKKEYIIKQVEQSLTNIHTTQIDLLLLHRPDLFMDMEEIYLAFKQLKQEGKVVEFGVSNYTPVQFKALNKYLSKRGIELKTNQIELNPYTTEHFDNDNVFYLKGEEIRPMIWSPYAGGELFQNNEISEGIAKIGEKYDLTISQVVISFLANQGLNPVIILGSQKIERYKEANAAIEKQISMEDMYTILKLLTKVDVR